MDYQELLEELHRHSDEITASALISVDGMMIAAKLPSEVSEDKVSAMSAAILSLGDRMIADLISGITDRVMLQSATGYVIVSLASQDMLLTVITKSDAKLGMIFHDIKKTACKLQSL